MSRTGSGLWQTVEFINGKLCFLRQLCPWCGSHVKDLYRSKVSTLPTGAHLQLDLNGPGSTVWDLGSTALTELQAWSTCGFPCKVTTLILSFFIYNMSIFTAIKEKEGNVAKLPARCLARSKCLANASLTEVGAKALGSSR